MIVLWIFEEWSPQEMDHPFVTNTAHIVENVVHIGIGQPYFAHDPLGCILVFQDEWDRYIDFKLAFLEQQ